MVKEIRELTIDPEFAAIGRRLLPEEENYLYASLTEEGCRDPIIVWANHDDTIVDGHSRYRLCREHEIPFAIRPMHFDDRRAVIDWIVRNALGRRNVTDEEKSYLRGKLYNEQKKQAGAQPGNENAKQRRTSRAIDSKVVRTAEKLADEFDVAPRTIQSDAEFAVAVDEIAENVGEETKSEILAGDSELTKQQVKQIAELPAKKQAKAVQKTQAANKKKKAAKKADVSERCSLLIERIESLVAFVDKLAAACGGHTNHSKEVNRSLKDCVSKVRSMERSWKDRESLAGKAKKKRPKPARA